MSPYGLTLTLPHRLTQTEIREVLVQLEREMDLHPGAKVLLNFASPTVFDSSAVALLIALRRRQISNGGQLLVDGWPLRLSQLARLYGVRELLER